MNIYFDNLRLQSVVYVDFGDYRFTEVTEVVVARLVAENGPTDGILIGDRVRLRGNSSCTGRIAVRNVGKYFESD